MANASILAAFERMWQHVVVAINNKTNTILASSKEYTDSAISSTLPHNTQVSLPVSGWDSMSLTQTVNVEGISADEAAQFITVAPAMNSLEAAIENIVVCCGQGANSLVFKCSSIPEADIMMNVSWQGAEWITHTSGGY